MVLLNLPEFRNSTEPGWRTIADCCALSAHRIAETLYGLEPQMNGVFDGRVSCKARLSLRGLPIPSWSSVQHSISTDPGLLLVDAIPHAFSKVPKPLVTKGNR